MGISLIGISHHNTPLAVRELFAFPAERQQELMKEMIARDNEVSILRKEDVSKAYFGVHTDITIPYKELKRISAVHADGTKTDIILDGRFVLEGLDELNKPLDEK